MFDEIAQALLTDFVPVQESGLGLRQPDVVIVAPIEEGELVESIAVDRVVLGVDDSNRQFVKAVKLKLDGLPAVSEMEDIDGHFTIELVRLSCQICRVLGGVEDQYPHQANNNAPCCITDRT